MYNITVGIFYILCHYNHSEIPQVFEAHTVWCLGLWQVAVVWDTMISELFH